MHLQLNKLFSKFDSPEFNFPKIQSIQYENLFKYVYYYMELKRKHLIHIGKAMMRIDYWWNSKIHRTHVKDQWYLCICTSTRSDKYIEELCTKRKNMFVLVSVYQMQILWSGPAHKGLNLPKRFINLHISDSSSLQNEKRLSYRKQKK